MVGRADRRRQTAVMPGGEAEEMRNEVTSFLLT